MSTYVVRFITDLLTSSGLQASASAPFGMKMTISAIKKQFPEVKNLDTDTLAQWMDECNAGICSNDGKDESDLEQVEQSRNFVILDVRPEEEAAISMIPSSTRVDPDERDMKELKKIIREKSLSKAPKKPNPWRPILNLKPLNKLYFATKRFRMETLASIIPTLVEGMWAISIDLKDAYLHVPIHPLIRDSWRSEEDQEPIYVVMYCSVGYRSSCLATRLQRSLQKEGKQDSMIVYNLEGSIFKWANENRSLVDPAGEPTEFVHPYNTIFGMLLDSSRRKCAP
ncbi:hypothetical protein HOLleu_09576 [Holothuria leucospilota]|uniref:Rhodanese domain-containing protein n=1 Tax=Holothuria leucospilota TaxID=206669 RepID=A0A9Q1HF20_HOLLE|nr:hypothetical protein HOLleu_09576 [Holothuria leucospilota]